MSRKKYFFYNIVLLLFLPIFFFILDDKADDMRNAIVGTWKLTSVTVDGANMDISTYPNLIQFQANTIFQAYNSSTSVKNRGGWSYEGEMLNISLYLPAAFYIMNIDAKNLTLKRYDFNTDGSLRTTIQQYQLTNDSEMV
jgi:hypothetical protein